MDGNRKNSKSELKSSKTIKHMPENIMAKQRQTGRVHRADPGAHKEAQTWQPECQLGVYTVL